MSCPAEEIYQTDPRDDQLVETPAWRVETQICSYMYTHNVYEITDCIFVYSLQCNSDLWYVKCRFIVCNVPNDTSDTYR